MPNNASQINLYIQMLISYPKNWPVSPILKKLEIMITKAINIPIIERIFLIDFNLDGDVTFMYWSGFLMGGLVHSIIS